MSNDRAKPTRNFVNLHAHTCLGSIYDALEMPDKHMNAVWNGGMDAMAITEHGNANSVAYALNHRNKMLKEGKKFKYIIGCETYFLPDLKQWRKEYDDYQKDKELNKRKKNIEEEKDTSFAKDFLRGKSHLILLAQNQEGLYNLYRMISLSAKRENFYRYPRIDFDMLKKYNKGLIASSACLSGYISLEYLRNREMNNGDKFEYLSFIIQKFLDIFGDRFYGELQFNSIREQHEINQIIISLSQKFGFELITTTDSHYPIKAAWKDREIYKRLGWMGKATAKPDFVQEELPKSIEDLRYELYPKNGDEVWQSYKDYSKKCNFVYDDDVIRKSLDNTCKIAFERIENFEPDKTIKLPTFVNVKDETPEYTLSRLAIEGLKKLNLDKKKNYVDRLKKEIKVIQKRKFSQYFLTMKQIMDFTRETQGIVGCARGSAGGCLLSYCLGITQIDPIKWQLQFERFLSEEAIGYPDIDIDVMEPMKLKEDLAQKWGEYSVIPVSNFTTLQLRSLVKDVSKFYDIPFQEVNEVTSKMLFEATPQAKRDHDIIAGVYNPTFEELRKYSKTFQKFIQKYPKIADHIEALGGQIRQISRHASGTIVGEKLNEYMPLIRSKDVIQTPWPEGQTIRLLEPMGFIKFDILGLASLRMMKQAIYLILKNHCNKEKPTLKDIKRFYSENVHPDTIDFNDQKVYQEVFHKFNFHNVFQFQEKGAQTFCVNAKPKSLEDISVITSIYRPSALCISGDSKILIRKNIYDTTRCARGKEFVRKRIKDIYEDFGNNRFKKQLTILNEDTYNFSLGKIKNVFKSGIKPVYRIIYQPSLTNKFYLSKKSILKSSLDHRFLTLDGWKKLKDLKEGDYICMRRGKHGKKHITKNTKYVEGKKNFRNIAFFNYQYKCIFCDWNKGSLDVNHLSGNRYVNNEKENLCFMCPNHHRMYSEGNIKIEDVIKEREKNILPFNDDIVFVRYLDKEYIGEEETYDIEVENDYHNFIAEEFVVHNSVGIDKEYIMVRNGEKEVEYDHPYTKEILENTQGFLIFQEQIASIVNKMGKNISLEEGNQLRKLLVKKGDEKNKDKKESIYQRFIEGCVEKGLTIEKSQKIWDNMEKFSGYGFNKSHACAYSIISFQCAWFLTYYPIEWACAFLEKDNDFEAKKEKSISAAKQMGLEIEEANINTSSDMWEISKIKEKTLIQPLTALKGLGEIAIQHIIENRPYNTIEDLLFHPNIPPSKVNKKCFEVLIKSQVLNNLMDERFNNLKHFYLSVCEKKPTNQKELDVNILMYSNTQDFIEEEKIEFAIEYTGNFPIDKVMSQQLLRRLKEKYIPPISEYDENLRVCWGIVTDVEKKITSKGKDYYIVTLIDSNFSITKVKCWGVNLEKDKLYLNRSYMVSLRWDDIWGFSSNGPLCKSWKLLG